MRLLRFVVTAAALAAVPSVGSVDRGIHILTELQWCLLNAEQAARNAECAEAMDVYEVVVPEDEPALGAMGSKDGCRWLGVQMAKQRVLETGWQAFVIAGASYLQVMTRCVPAVRGHKA